MSARAARGIFLATSFLICNTVALAWSAPAATETMDSGKNALSPETVVLETVPEAMELSSLKRIFPSTWDNIPSKIALRYYHPIVQICVYAGKQTGPSGRLLLPGYRQLKAETIFAVHIAGEERVLIPGAKGVQLRVSLQPARLSEEWVWPDGLVLTRTCFQAPDNPGVAIRQVVNNQSSTALNGLRFVANIYDPEIVGLTDQSRAEADDELFADPRSAVLYQRDYLERTESWLGTGWSTEGGLITAGEGVRSQEAAALQLGLDVSGLRVSLETPAKDLASGQFYKSTFWIIWGSDREFITKAFVHLRKSSDYRTWEARHYKNIRQGMSFDCKDKHLTYLFQSLKAWTPWMIRKNSFAQLQLDSLANNHPVLPEDVVKGIAGLVAFRQLKAIRHYLDYWLDQRTETPSAAYTLILAHRYFFLTQDKNWLTTNLLRIKELATYLLEMDANQDGLPEYHVPGDYSGYSQNPKPQYGEVKYFRHALASIWAYTCTRTLLMHSQENELTNVADTCHAQAQKGEKALERFFCQEQEGAPGYYTAALSSQIGRIPYSSSDAIEMVRIGLGNPKKRAVIFKDLWEHEEWRLFAGRYRKYLNQDSGYTGDILFNQNSIDFTVTHSILLEGLLLKSTATEAVERLLLYAHKLVTDPAILAMPGKQIGGIAALDVSCLNLIELITTGLCGLEPVCEGLRINLPEYSQDLDIKIKGLPFRRTILNVSVLTHKSGRSQKRASQIWINNERIKSGTVITDKQLGQKEVNIKIERFSPPVPSKRPVNNKKPKKKRRRKH